MAIIDSHCHVFSCEDPKQVIQSTLALTKACLVCLNQHELSLAIGLKRKYPHKFIIAYGIYPMDVYDYSPKQRSEFYQAMTHPMVDIVGEIGLEYNWEKDSEKQALQREVFIEQIEVANFIGKPINIHTRDAWDDTLRILKQHPTKATLHCYSGSVEIAKECLKMGHYLSFSGIVTFKNANKLLDVVKMCPLDRILVETDSPYMAPVPYRGQENHPIYVQKVIERIAELKEIDSYVLSKIVEGNLNRFLNQ